MTRRRGFRVAFKAIVAFGVFTLAVVFGIMTGFGPELVLGPPIAQKGHSLRSAVNARTGLPVDAAFFPRVIGPGMLYELRLPIQGGLEGHVALRAVEVETDHPLWPGARRPQYGKVDWPDSMPESEPRMVHVAVGGLNIPEHPKLAFADVRLHVRVEGVRPWIEGQYLVDQEFTEEFDVRCTLGRGRVYPTGLWNLDLYNRTTTGLLAVLCLAITAWLMKKPIKPALARWEEQLPPRGKR